LKLQLLPLPVRGISVLVLLILSVALTAQVSFSYHSSYSYLKGSEAQSLASNWMLPAFSYSSWAVGPAPFHYGDGTGGTELTDMIENYTTLYLRSSFECSGTELIDKLTLTIDYDDGFIVWINGVPALSVNAPSSPAWNSLAPDNHESGTGTDFVVFTDGLNLTEGTNYLAIQCFNVSSTSTDFYFDMAMLGERDIPEYNPGGQVLFSHPSGLPHPTKRPHWYIPSTVAIHRIQYQLSLPDP